MAAGSITFNLLMMTGSFETDTKKAEKRLQALEKQAKEFGTAVGAGLTAGFAALTYAVKQTIDAADEASKASQKIGITTESLSALTYAADLSGVASENLNKSMVKLSKNATEGSEAFDAMGISTKDANGDIKKADVLLAEIADKFAGYKDGAEKSTLAMELFGKEGAAMIPLLNGGSAGLKAMGDEARDLGVILYSEAGKRAEAFNDNLSRLGTAAKGVATGIMAEMLPALVGLTDGFIETVKGSGFVEKAAKALTTGLRQLVSGVLIVGGAFKTVGDFLGGVFALVVEGVSGVITGTVHAISAIGQALYDVATGDFDAAGKRLAGVFDGYGDALNRVVQINKDVGGDLVGNIQGTVDAVGKVWEDGAVKIRSTADQVGTGLAAPIVGAGKKAKEAGDKMRKEAEALRKKMIEEGQRMAESVQTPAEKRQAADTKTNKFAEGGFINPETQQRLLDQSKKQYDDFIAAQYDALNQGLLTQEEATAESYRKRKETILKLTDVTGQEKQAAIAKLDEQQRAGQFERLREGLKTESELAIESHAKRIKAIGELTRLSEEERLAAIAATNEQFATAQRDRELAAVESLLTEKEKIELDYLKRRKAILDAGFVEDQDRINALELLEVDKIKRIAAVDEEDAKKKKDAEKATLDAVAAGFAGTAELAKAFGGEQSKTYMAMFAASKAFALAETTVKQSQAIAKAWGENNFWVAGGLSVALAGQFAGLYSSINNSSFGGTRADGGGVNANRRYLVGERGPEMFTPNTAGAIIPNDMLQPQQQSSNIRIVNAYDSEHVADFMGSASGERVIMNAVRKNQAAIRAMATT